MSSDPKDPSGQMPPEQVRDRLTETTRRSRKEQLAVHEFLNQLAEEEVTLERGLADEQRRLADEQTRLADEQTRLSQQKLSVAAKARLDYEQIPSDPTASLPYEASRSSLEPIQELQLSGVLMQDGWFGLRLLYVIQGTERGLTATELSAQMAEPIDFVMPTTSLLVRYGAVDVSDGRFVCTHEGTSILHRIDTIISEPEVKIAETVQ